MKVNPKFLMIMVALTAGVASAQATANKTNPPVATSAGTAAGTVITNTATATYDDPNNPGTPVTPIPSNTVSTSVTPITGFDVVYAGGEIDDKDPAGVPSTYKVANVLPGGTVTTKYTVLNNSNIDQYRVDLTAVTTGALPTVAPTGTAGGVQYFADDNDDGVRDSATPLTFVTLANGGLKHIVQVLTVPSTTTVAAGAVYSATPQGNAPASTTGTSAVSFTNYAEGSNQNTPGTAPTNGDLQPTVATVTTPALAVIPPPSIPGYPTVTTPGTGNTPPPGVTPPGNTYVPPTNPDYGTPTVPKPGTPNNPGTVIALNGPDQDAYPKADAEIVNNDVVTFVSDVKNTDTIDDTIKIKPNTSGLPTGATIKVLDKNGTELTADANGLYTIPYAPNVATPGSTVVKTPPNESAQYQLVVTYPDSDISTPQVNIAVPVKIFSGNVPSTTEKAASTFTIHPPQMQFGDATLILGTDPTPVENQVVKPDATAATTTTDRTDRTKTSDSTAVFPMDVANRGQYSDQYVLEATTSVTGATVKYFYADGNEVSKVGGKYQTTTVVLGTELKVFAVVDVPSSTAAGVYTVSQKATGLYSTIVKEDNTDTITVIAVGKVGVAKFVAKAPTTTNTETITNNTVDIKNPTDYTAVTNTAAPKTDISYRIIAKNTYNSPVSAFHFSDVVPANTDFKSLGLRDTATDVVIATTKVLYRFGTSGTWIKLSVATPATQVAGTTVQIALDDNGDGAPDALPIGGSLSADFVVTVK